MANTPAQAAIEAAAEQWPDGTEVISDSDIVVAARMAGATGNGLVTGVAIALAESGGNALARNYNPGVEDSRGLWQINIFAHPSYARGELFDPAPNAAAAAQISGGWTVFSAWSTYTSGAYKGFLNRAAAAANVSPPGAAASSLGSSPPGGLISIPWSKVPGAAATAIGGAAWKAWFGDMSPGTFAIRGLEIVGGAVLMMGGLTVLVLILARKEARQLGLFAALTGRRGVLGIAPRPAPPRQSRTPAERTQESYDRAKARKLGEREADVASFDAARQRGRAHARAAGPFPE